MLTIITISLFLHLSITAPNAFKCINALSRIENSIPDSVHHYTQAPLCQYPHMLDYYRLAYCYARKAYIEGKQRSRIDHTAALLCFKINIERLLSWYKFLRTSLLAMYALPEEFWWEWQARTIFCFNQELCLCWIGEDIYQYAYVESKLKWQVLYFNWYLGQ